MRFFFNRFFIVLFIYTAQALLGSSLWAQDISELQKKCLIEVKYNFVPQNCFRWLQKTSLNKEKTRFFQDWFDTVCTKAIKYDQGFVQYHMSHLEVLSSKCRQNIERAFLEWSYKSKVVNPEKVFKILIKPSAHKIGKDIEYDSSYDLE